MLRNLKPGLLFATLDGGGGGDGAPPAGNNSNNTPPAGGETPPAGTPAPGGTTPPAGGGTPPAPGGTTPPAGGEPPKPGSENKPPEGAPEKYADFKLPSGFSMDKEFGDKFLASAKRDNLSQEKAQEYVNLHITALNRAFVQHQEHMQQERTNIQKMWDEDLKKDPDFGGLKYNDTTERANRALRTIAGAMGERGKALLKDFSTGNASTPEMFIALALVDKWIGEHTVVTGKPPAPSADKKTAGENVYPDMNKHQTGAK